MRMTRVSGRCRAGRVQGLWILLLTVIALGLSAGCSSSGGSAAAASGSAPPGGGKGGRKGGMAGDAPVTVAVATIKDVPVEVQVIANVEAYSTISVKAQVTGQLVKQQ